MDELVRKLAEARADLASLKAEENEMNAEILTLIEERYGKEEERLENAIAAAKEEAKDAYKAVADVAVVPAGDYHGPNTKGLQAWVQLWRHGLLNDGWTEKQTYPGSEMQPECYTYKREGWTVGIYNNELAHGKGRWHISISVWGPGSISIDRPDFYDWDEFRRLLHVCQYCGEEVEETVRLGFAGRACPACRVKLAPEIEYPGWAN